MNEKYICAETLIARLEENHLKYLIFPLQNEAFAVVTERGGRILGPFLSQESEPSLWVHPAFAQREAFQQFLVSGNWNLGGERNWIAPEVQYLFSDRERIDETVRIPPEMDPGAFRLEQEGTEGLSLSQELALEAFNVASGIKRLKLKSQIRRVPDPLRFVSDYLPLIEGVHYFGYEQQVMLAEDQSNEIMSEVWNLIQLRPGGEVILPISTCFETTDYVDSPVDDRYQTYQHNSLMLRITGDHIYKTGFRAAHHTGRLAYFRQIDPETGTLIVRNFYNNPSSVYVEEPWNRVGHRGDSIHIYNDDGRWGGFGELEVHGQTIGGVSGRSQSTDPFTLWFYTGPVEKLKQISSNLLGAPPYG